MERLYRLFPAFDSGEDALWIGGPYEGFGIGVCLGEEAVDGDLQVTDGSEHASLEATARELGEEAFDRIEPGCRGWREVERGIPGQPLAYLRMLVATHASKARCDPGRSPQVDGGQALQT